MAKEITGYLKLQVKGGAANPAPPIGPALGSKGLNIMDFCKQFNARSQDKPGQVLPVLITMYNDKSFDFVIKTPPAAVLIMEAIKIQKSGQHSRCRLCHLNARAQVLPAESSYSTVLDLDDFNDGRDLFLRNQRRPVSNYLFNFGPAAGETSYTRRTS